MKICSKCKTEKDPLEFSIERTRKDGRSIMCKTCTRARAAIRRQKGKDAVAAVYKAYEEKMKLANKENL
jgi:hypothetical protein